VQSDIESALWSACVADVRCAGRASALGRGRAPRSTAAVRLWRAVAVACVFKAHLGYMLQNCSAVQQTFLADAARAVHLGFRPRSEIPMGAVVGRPLLLHLGAVAPPQRALAARLEAAKLAGVAQLGAACDMAIIPHANARNALHFVGLLVRPAACARPLVDAPPQWHSAGLQERPSACARPPWRRGRTPVAPCGPASARLCCSRPAQPP